MGFFNSVGNFFSHPANIVNPLTLGTYNWGKGVLDRSLNAGQGGNNYSVSGPTTTPLSDSDINSQFQQYLGRDATAQEMSSFKQYGNNGSVPLTSFDIGQIVQGMPQYQTQQLQNFGQQYQNMLGASDQRILGLAQQNTQQQFASQGRNMSSSGYLNAYAEAAANLATSRQQQLAGFYGQGYQGIMGSEQQQAQGAQSFGLGQQASSVDWQRQQVLANQYQQWFAQQQAAQRKSDLFGMLGQVGGGLLGAGVGTAVSGGNPMGAAIGFGAGSQIGGGFGQYAGGNPSYGRMGGGFSGGYNPY